MKNNWKICHILVWLVVCCSCKQGGTMGSMQTLNVTFPEATASLSLSDITSSVELIPLETSDSVIIGKVSRIIALGNDLYIADNTSVYKYNQQGVIQGTFCRKGSGPEEYTGISDFCLSADGNVWILNRNNQSLLHYAWDGTFLREIKLDAWASRICRLDERTLLLYIGNEKDDKNAHQLKVLNLESGEILNSFLPIDDKKAAYLHVMVDNYFAGTGRPGQTYFYQMFNDTVYSVSAGELSPAYVVNLDGKNIPSSFYETGYSDILKFFQSLSKHSYAYGLNFFLEKQGTCWLSYYYNQHCYMSVVSDDGVCKTGVQLLEDTHLHGFPILLEELPLFELAGGELCICLQPMDIMMYAEEHLSADQQAEIKQKIKYLGDDQNVVLLKVRI